MAYFAAGFGLMAHVFFWGAGAALLLTPRRWRLWWFFFAFPAGIALQSAVVWIGAKTGAPGTDAYARTAELLPAALLVVAVRRVRLLDLRRAFARFVPALSATIAALAVFLGALARSESELTTVSLGNCDAADYAAGARVFQEFSRSDRDGFMGLTEVVSIGPVDNFYDFWLRLNHFTPSALIALNGSALGYRPFELTGVLTAVLAALTLPAGFLLARSTLGLSVTASTWVALVGTLGPILWYAVAQVATGQLLATQGIGLLTWCVVALWRGPLRLGNAVRMSGPLFLIWWLLLGAYNLIVPVALAPGALIVGWRAFRARNGRRFAAWCAALAVPLLVAALLFSDRSLGILDRYRLLLATDFGWRVPALTPEGWLGAVSSAGLEPFPGFGIRMILCAALAGLFLVFAFSGRRRNRAITAAFLALPAVMGYVYLEARGAWLGTNASYDAYKLLSVFLPGVIAALCLWTSLIRRAGGIPSLAALAGVAGISLLVLNASSQFWSALRRPPLVVDDQLVALGGIERLPGVGSVNMLIPDMWSRLWANAFLLRVPQYFEEHTYEGRRNTPLRGDWDLLGGLVRETVPDGGSLAVDARFGLVDRRNPRYLDIRMGDGWYAIERLVQDGSQWRWAAGTASIRIENPGGRTLHTNWTFRDVRGLTPRRLRIVATGGATLADVAIGDEATDIRIPDIAVPAGGLTLELSSDLPARPPGPNDSRLLAFRVHGIDVVVDPPRDDSDSPASPRLAP